MLSLAGHCSLVTVLEAIAVLDNSLVTVLEAIAVLDSSLVTELEASAVPDSSLAIVLEAMFFSFFFNRPGVAGAVLQTPQSLNDWLIN